MKKWRFVYGNQFLRNEYLICQKRVKIMTKAKKMESKRAMKVKRREVEETKATKIIETRIKAGVLAAVEIKMKGEDPKEQKAAVKVLKKTEKRNPGKIVTKVQNLYHHQGKGGKVQKRTNPMNLHHQEANETRKVNKSLKNLHKIRY